jgi:hypothetical protein
MQPLPLSTRRCHCTAPLQHSLRAVGTRRAGGSRVPAARAARPHTCSGLARNQALTDAVAQAEAPPIHYLLRPQWLAAFPGRMWPDAAAAAAASAPARPPASRARRRRVPAEQQLAAPTQRPAPTLAASRGGQPGAWPPGSRWAGIPCSTSTAAPGLRSPPGLRAQPGRPATGGAAGGAGAAAAFASGRPDTAAARWGQPSRGSRCACAPGWRGMARRPFTPPTPHPEGGIVPFPGASRQGRRSWAGAGTCAGE